MKDIQPKPASKEPHIQILIVIVISALVYSNTLGHGFVWDDADQVLGNPWIKDAGFLSRIFSSGAWDFKLEPTNYYRPLTHVIFMLEYFLFGLKPWGFHLVNVLLHVFSSVLVFLIARELFRGYKGAGNFFTAAFIAGVLFAAHPVHTEAVAWVSAITDLSCAFFFLLSLYLYIRSENGFNPGYYFSAAAFFLAALCKEPAITLPALMFAYDMMLSKNRPGLVLLVKRYAVFALAIAVYLGLRYHALGGLAPVKKISEYGSFGDLLVIIATDLTKMVMPVNLKAIYTFSPAVSFFEARVLYGAVLAAAVIILFYIAYRHDKPAFFCLLLVAVPLLPSLYVLASGGASLLSERYLYLPSAGLVMLAALVIARVAVLKRRTAAVSVFLALAALFSVGTLVRNAVWRDDYSLWVDTVRKSPASAEAHDSLGVVYAKRGQDGLAEKEFLESLTCYPIAENAYSHLGILYGKQGKVDEAITVLKEALKVKPGDPDTHNELGIQYVKRGELNMAVEQFREAIRLNPSNTMFRGNLEKALRETDISSAGGR